MFPLLQPYSDSWSNLLLCLWTIIGVIHCQNATNGLRCLSCHEASTPSDCLQWVTCGENEECFAREFQNRYMEKVYHLGCESKERCDFVYRVSALLGKRETRKCFQCCNHDDCNSALCGAATPATTPTELRCLDCHAVNDPRLCDTWSRCGMDEVCFTRTFMDAGVLKFKMGCEYRESCAVPSLAGTTPPPTPWDCMKCCSHDDCNAAQCTSLVGYTGHRLTNISTGGCPPSFIRGEVSCYYISNVTASWTSANTICQNMSASLVSIETKQKDAILQRFLNMSTNSNFGVFWTGGYYVTATRGWHWVDLQPVTYFNWGPSQPRYSSYTYRIALLNPAKNAGFKGWQWATITYSNAYNYICETGIVHGR